MPRSAQRKYQPGDIVGDWTVLGFSHQKAKTVFWLCKCKCGTQKPVQQSNLRSGHSTKCSKCGTQPKHGMCGTRVYSIWAGMKNRCKPNYSACRNYNERGIKVCERWNSFEAFYQDMGHPPTNAHTLERVDNDKGYSPDNCQWATRSEQARNRRTNTVLTFNEISQCIVDWSIHTGLPVSTIRCRIKLGWPVEDTLTIPVGEGRRERVGQMIEHNGETIGLNQWSKRVGISADCIRARLKRGWTVSDALSIPLKNIPK